VADFAISLGVLVELAGGFCGGGAVATDGIAGGVPRLTKVRNASPTTTDGVQGTVFALRATLRTRATIFILTELCNELR